MMTPDCELLDYDYHQAGDMQQRQHGLPFDLYRNGGMAADSPQQQQQFYLHEPSPSRRTWGQAQPMSPAPMPPQTLPVHSMAYRQPMDDVYGTVPMRRAQWGTPQPVS